MILRHATIQDAELLWQWRNDEEVLCVSGSTEAVSNSKHYDWLSEFLKNPKQSLQIAFVDDRPIGMGRIAVHPLDYIVGACKISYSIDRAYRGKGHGKELVARIVKEAQMMGYSTIVARIKRGNTRSVICAMLAGVTAIEFFP